MDGNESRRGPRRPDADPDPWRGNGRETRREGEPLEQRLDRWVSTGRQFVEGVSGARPGARQGVRGGERRSGGGPSLDGLGRWVENRLDWLLEDGDDWREPWQEERKAAPGRGAVADAERTVLPPPGRTARRSLEAISRRGPLPPGAPSDASSDAPAPAAPEPWPDEEAFSVPRWRRATPPREEPSPPPPASGDRPLPRSTRRR
jgi:hypothetical protein